MGRRKRFTLFFLLLLHHSAVQIAWADNIFKPDGSCSRTFIYRNRTYPVDSSRKLDGEGLRFLMKKDNQSELLLNDYQGKLRSSYMPAYVGSLGVALAIGGPIYAGTRHTELGQRDTRNVLMFSGIFMIVAAYVYGKYAFDAKEKTLEKAVETYNDAVPAPERIRVEIAPTPTGSGGEIKTQVPF